MVKITDRPNMILAVYHGHEATTQSIINQLHYVNIPMHYTVIFTPVKFDNFLMKKCDILS